MTFKEWISSGERIDKLGDNIAEQWTGIDEHNCSVDIDKITIGSGKKLLWKCKNGHFWLAKIVHRTYCLSGCSMCNKASMHSKVRRGKLKPGVNDLLTWCESNGERGKQLIQEYTGILEDDTKVNMNELSYGTSVKVLWRCYNGHEWYATVGSRTNTKCKCPYCSGSRVIEGNNDLHTWCIANNRTDLIEQFVGEDIKGNNIDIHSVMPMSHTKVFWKHYKNNKEHRWLASIRHRTLNNSNCPYCNGSKKVLSGFNDLGTWCKNNPDYGKVIEEQFTGIDIHGNKIDIDKIATFSYSNLLWRHTKGTEVHEWYSTLYNRISHRTQCPICSNKGTSFTEQVIYRCIKQIYPNTISRGKFQGYEFDIAIPELKTCIEYGSTYYHIGREDRDNKKVELCNKHNVRLIVIMEDSSIDADNEVWEHDYILVKSRTNKVDNIKRIMKFLLKQLSLNYKCIDINKAINETHEFMNGE